MLLKLQEKVQCGKGERKLNFDNKITKILILPTLPKMETNCGNGIAENGRKKKRIVATKLPKMDGKKKDATSTTFFTTNYRWLVVIGSNLNLILRLLFCPYNNNQ